MEVSVSYRQPSRFSTKWRWSNLRPRSQALACSVQFTATRFLCTLTPRPSDA